MSIFDQWCDPGLGAPTHLQAAEEVLTVLSGQAEIWLADDRATVGASGSVIIPAGRFHGFRNIGLEILHVEAVLAAPIFEARQDDQTKVARRWLAD